MCKCAAYLPRDGSPFCFLPFCLIYKYLLCLLYVLKRTYHNFSKHCRWQRVAHKQTLQQFISRPDLFIEVLVITKTYKPQIKYRHTCRLPVLVLCCSIASAPPLLPDFPAKWQLVSPWTGSWYQPESAARLINLIDLQRLENKLFEQLCLSDHISLPKSTLALVNWPVCVFFFNLHTCVKESEKTLIYWSFV